MEEAKTPVKKAFLYAVQNSRPVDTGPMKLKLIQRLLDFIADPEPNEKKLKRDCRVYLKSYQQACGKENESDEEKSRIFKSAKWMTQTIFKSLEKGRDKIRNIELSHSTKEVISPMSLEHFEEVEQIVVSQMQNLSHRTKAIVFSTIDERLNKWRDCYEGRRMYRMVCESKRDKNHDAAYWFFKLAYLAGRIINMNKSSFREIVSPS